MENIEKIIKSHNKSLLSKTAINGPKCNCQKKDQCPLNGNCIANNVVYAAQVVTQNTRDNPQNTPNDRNTRTTRQTRTRRRPERDRVASGASLPTTTQDTTSDDVATSTTPPVGTTYIGAAEDFKARYRNHIKSFNNIRYQNDTELSKLI